jgi:hypothetical protein
MQSVGYRKIYFYLYTMSIMTADEWEAAFHGIELPETVQLGPGMFVNDVQEFLDKSIHIVRHGVPRVTDPVQWRLQTLLDIVSENNGTKE